MTPIEHNTKSVREFMERVWSKGDAKVAERILHPNFQFILAFAHLDGRDTFLGLVDRNRHIFENLTYTVATDDIVAEAYKAATYWRMDAKHIGTWRNVPASNKTVWINGMTFFRFDEAGKITEVRVQNDVLSLMNQIGGIKKLYDF